MDCSSDDLDLSLISSDGLTKIHKKLIDSYLDTSNHRIDKIKPLKHQDKPPYSYASLITEAINSSDNKKMTLREIYFWIMENYPFYQEAKTDWKNAIRHNLSIYNCFVKTPRPKEEPGKGSYWEIVDISGTNSSMYKTSNNFKRPIIENVLSAYDNNSNDAVKALYSANQNQNQSKNNVIYKINQPQSTQVQQDEDCSDVKMDIITVDQIASLKKNQVVYKVEPLQVKKSPVNEKTIDSDLKIDILSNNHVNQKQDK